MPSEVIIEKLSSLSKLNRADIADFSKENFEVSTVAESYARIYCELDAIKDTAGVQ